MYSSLSQKIGKNFIFFPRENRKPHKYMYSFLEISIITSKVLHIITAAGFIFVSEAHFFLRYRTESNLHILFSPLARITILNGKIIPSVTSILQGRYSVL